MNIVEDVLIVDDELNDEMLDELTTHLKNDEIEKVVIETDNISSLALQQLIIYSEEKLIECNNPFIEKFFEDIEIVK